MTACDLGTHHTVAVSTPLRLRRDIRRLGLWFAFACACNSGSAPEPGKPTPPPPASSPFTPNDVVLDQDVAMLDGTRASLASYRGKALLVVNTASECGYTPQYAGLQKLYGELKPRGLEVLAFPSDDFGHQEPGDAQEIRTFVDEKFAIEFPMFDKVHAKGPDISPVYRALAEQSGDGIRGEVKWNFTKFIVDPQGKIVARFEPEVEPDDPTLRAALESVLPPPR